MMHSTTNSTALDWTSCCQLVVSSEASQAKLPREARGGIRCEALQLGGIGTD